MTRPRLSRAAMDALYAQAMAENAERQMRELERRIAVVGREAREALKALRPKPSRRP